MILLPLRHVVALDELTAREVAALGPLLAATSSALRAVVGCLKTYVMLFAEREGFEHVHFHIVPRMPDLHDDQLGPGTLRFLNHPEEDWVPAGERARLAHEIGARVRAQLSGPPFFV